MNDKHKIIQINEVQNRIFTIRGLHVMVDRDLSELYAVPTKRLNEQVKRNIQRFPETFRFQLTESENTALIRNCDRFRNLRSQIATSSEHGGRRYFPYVFTEQGIAMLSAVLRSDIAIMVSIQIMNAFVEMRKFISINTGIFQRLTTVEQKQLIADEKFEELFKALEDKSQKPKQGIFYDGQVFDAYVFISDLIKTAKKSIVLIDNSIDESILKLLSKRNKKATATIYTKKISQILIKDLEKHNAQYPAITLKVFKKSHDRFIIIDRNTVYHIGASLKDLGKKWFAFSKMNKATMEILTGLKDSIY